MGSALAGVMFVWSMLSPLLPRQLFEHFVGRFLRRHARRLAGLVDPYLTVTISEHCGERMKLGDVYEQAKAYLSHRRGVDNEERRGVTQGWKRARWWEEEGGGRRATRTTAIAPQWDPAGTRGTPTLTPTRTRGSRQEERT
uniref:AAA-type ATPase N-terminal domain-containing protein n=1 Tax=Oryza barthii TaxID=65489 RepID=A0A0D3GN98_9ORYZ